MMYKANVDVLRSVHDTQHTARTFRMSECQTWWYVKKHLGFIWYIFFFTAVGLTPGGSSTSHIYTQTVRIINSTHKGLKNQAVYSDCVNQPHLLPVFLFIFLPCSHLSVFSLLHFSFWTPLTSYTPKSPLHVWWLGLILYSGVLVSKYYSKLTRPWKISAKELLF
jgi:hypothetical protein